MSGNEERPEPEIKCHCGSIQFKRVFTEYGVGYYKAGTPRIDYDVREFEWDDDWQCVQCRTRELPEVVIEHLERL